MPTKGYKQSREHRLGIGFSGKGLKHPNRKRPISGLKRNTHKSWSSLSDRWYRVKYGITEEQYNTLLKNQNGVCAICKKPEMILHKGITLKKLSVDHDHSTGKVRGLLCHNCNLAIGYFEDNSTVVYNAYMYLNKVKS